MNFSGTVEIGAPRQAVWAFLMDPTRVGSCGPGVESVEVVDETHFRARAKVRVGPVGARFNIDLEMAERTPPDHAEIKAHGLAPGTAVDALSSMTLRDGPRPDTTMIDWTADVTVSGTIASLGLRMLEGTANKMIGQTFNCIRSKLEEAPAVAR